MRCIIGVDEVGRGPIAGPVTVAAFCVLSRHRLRLLDFFPRGVLRDSKKLSPDARENIFSRVKKAKASGSISYSVFSVSAKVIDAKGITYAIKKALSSSLRLFEKYSENTLVLLDGGLSAPAQFRKQKTIVKGDEKEPAIALASIVAKVTRDRHMKVLAKKHPNYGFEIHKGYGTKAHYQKLQARGLSPIHRRSFLKNLLPK